jgi:glucose/arabinose dehydrogenase
MPGADPDVWDLGLRNPWRWSFDRCTGDMYLGDVGQGSVEEIDFEAAGQGHNNFGWNFYEGSSCYEAPCDPAGVTMPIAEYSHAEGCATIGGYVYRGASIPGLRGTYLYGDICAERILSLVVSGGVVVGQGELTDDLDAGNILSTYGFSSFGEDAAGELYVCDMAGFIYRIDAE